MKDSRGRVSNRLGLLGIPCWVYIKRAWERGEVVCLLLITLVPFVHSTPPLALANLNFLLSTATFASPLSLTDTPFKPPHPFCLFNTKNETKTIRPNTMLTPRTPFLARATQTLRATSSLRTPLHRRFLSSTRPLSQAAAREEHSAHTVTHRVRFWVKSLPIETYPLCKWTSAFLTDLSAVLLYWPAAILGTILLTAPTCPLTPSATLAAILPSFPFSTILAATSTTPSTIPLPSSIILAAIPPYLHHRLLPITLPRIPFHRPTSRAKRAQTPQRSKK